MKFLVACLAVSLTAAACFGVEVKVGDEIKFPQVVNEAGEKVDFAAYKGKKGLVIFFYPKADTPG